MSETTSEANRSIFRDTVSEYIIREFTSRQIKKKPTKRALRKSKGTKLAVETSQDGGTEEDTESPEGLTDFIDYIASELFDSLPEQLQTLSFTAYRDLPSLQDSYPLTPPLPPATITVLKASISPDVADTLALYLFHASEVDNALRPIVTDLIPAYLALATAPPPSHNTAPPPPGSPCEICQRTQLPLTYHHLVPRAVHAKAVKRGWHREADLNVVAWLCRACHSFVHRIASNEELAREWYSVELLTEREDVRKWAQWIGTVRWKKR